MNEPTSSVSSVGIKSDIDKPLSDGPVGLGGWLILPILGLIATPIIMALSVKDYLDLWNVRAFFTNFQVAFLTVELIANIVVNVAAPLLLLWLLSKKLEIFPGLYIIWICALPVFLLLDSLASLWVLGDLISVEDAFDRDTKKSIAQSVGQAILWTLYMNRSRRVANTFVN